MDYEKVLQNSTCYAELIYMKKSEKEDVLSLIRYFHERGYSHDQAHRIMKLAGVTMRCAAGAEKV